MQFLASLYWRSVVPSRPEPHGCVLKAQKLSISLHEPSAHTQLYAAEAYGARGCRKVRALLKDMIMCQSIRITVQGQKVNYNLKQLMKKAWKKPQDYSTSTRVPASAAYPPEDDCTDVLLRVQHPSAEPATGASTQHDLLACAGHLNIGQEEPLSGYFCCWVKRLPSRAVCLRPLMRM